MSNKFLNRDAILNLEDREVKEIYIAEWETNVRIKAMSGYHRDKLEISVYLKNGGQDASNVRAKWAAYSIVDDKGKLMFSEADINKLGQKNSSALDRIYEAIMSFNKIDDKAIEEEAKN